MQGVEGDYAFRILEMIQICFLTLKGELEFGLEIQRAGEKEQVHRAISLEERLKQLDLFTSEKG